MSELPDEYDTFAFLINEGDKVRFDIGQTTDAYPSGGTLDQTISGTVTMVTDGGPSWPHEVCLSLSQGNFWFDLGAQVTYTGQATPEELDYEYTANYYTASHGEGHPDA